MINGAVTHIGTMDVDGDLATGIFVECSQEDLKNIGKNMFGMYVIVSTVNEENKS